MEPRERIDATVLENGLELWNRPDRVALLQACTAAQEHGRELSYVAELVGLGRSQR